MNLNSKHTRLTPDQLNILLEREDHKSKKRFIDFHTYISHIVELHTDELDSLISRVAAKLVSDNLHSKCFTYEKAITILKNTVAPNLNKALLFRYTFRIIHYMRQYEDVSYSGKYSLVEIKSITAQFQKRISNLQKTSYSTSMDQYAFKIILATDPTCRSKFFELHHFIDELARYKTFHIFKHSIYSVHTEAIL